MTVIRSRWPRAFTRSTQKPLSSLWKVTLSTRPARFSRAGSVADDRLTSDPSGFAVVPGHAPFAPEVAGVRAGVDRPHRHHETQAVGRRHLAAAPALRQLDAVLRRDQGGIGGGERLGPQEVLLHPTQPRAPECRHVEADERLEAGVGSTPARFDIPVEGCL